MFKYKNEYCIMVYLKPQSYQFTSANKVTLSMYNNYIYIINTWNISPYNILQKLPPKDFILVCAYFLFMVINQKDLRYKNKILLNGL